MSRRIVHTEIEIYANAERVWEVLTDFPSYPEWNPMISRASGELQPGARLRVQFESPGGKARTFRPKLLVVEPNRELRWLGSPGVPGLLQSQHYFTIAGKPDGRARLDHGMVFYGLLVPLAGNRLEGSTRGPFVDMNRALKERAEMKTSSP